MNDTSFPRRLILASASPRRHDILNIAGIPHEIRAADADETLPADITPADAVEMLSGRKAAAAHTGKEDEIILAADTVVSLGDRILGKQRDAAEAASMLHALSGTTHAVYTGYTIPDGRISVTSHEKTVVRMRAILPEEIDAYIATGEPMDKAGAYGIQGGAALFCERMVGDYYNVMGLPVCRLGQVLKAMTPEK